MSRPIEVRNPRNGKFDYVIIPPPERLLLQKCNRLRRAQKNWQEIGLEIRIAALQEWKQAIISTKDKLSEALVADTGSWVVSQLEINSFLGSIDYWCKFAYKILRSPRQETNIRFIQLEQTGGRVDVEPLPTIEVDRTQMRQVFQNLLGNALKFRKPDTAPQIRISSQQYSESGQELCELHICDNGIGFDLKYGDRIFQPFQRLHGRKTYEGSGIGLAVCRKVVERHGGTITVQSQPDQGAIFIVKLPIAHPDLEENHESPSN